MAAFQGPGANSSTSSSGGSPGNATGNSAGSPGNATHASSGGGGTNATSSDSAPRASAAQLASIYILPRDFSLTQLAALDGQVVQTQAGEQWRLSVHSVPSSSERAAA